VIINSVARRRIVRSREEKRLQNSQKSQNIGEEWEGDNPKRRSERRAKELQIRAQARAEESITET